MSVPKGTRIHVEFDAVVEEDQDYDHRATYLVRSEKTGSFHYVFIHDDYFTEDEWRDVKVAPPVVPRFWPPQEGDIWTLDGHPPATTYYAYRDDDAKELKFMADGIGYCTYPIHDGADYEGMGWTLLFRNGKPVDIG